MNVNVQQTFTMQISGRRHSLVLIVCVMAMFLSGCHEKQAMPVMSPEEQQYKQGMTLLHSGDVQGAHAAFDSAIRLNAGFAPAYMAQAEIETDTGNISQAITLLEKLRSIAPQTPHIACHLAELHVATGNFVEGEDAAKQALQAEPNCPLAKTQFALELAAAGNAKDAIALMQSAHQLAPQNQRILLILAQMLAHNGNIQEAWKLLDAVPVESALPAQADYMRGWMLAEFGREGKRDDKAALQLLDRALALTARDGPANLEKGRILLRAGDAHNALKYLQIAHATSGPSVELLATVAEAQAKLGNPAAPRMKASALAFSKMADQLYAARRRYLASPDNREADLLLARLEAATGNQQDAQDLLTRVLKRNPNDVEALQMLTPHSEDSAGSHKQK